MDRIKVLNENEYMFKVGVEPGETLQSIFELVLEYGEESGAGFNVQYVSENEPAENYPMLNDTGINQDYIIIDFHERMYVYPSYIIWENSDNLYVLDVDEVFGNPDMDEFDEDYWYDIISSGFEEFEYGFGDGVYSEAIQDSDACAEMISNIFSDTYGEPFGLVDYGEPSGEIDESVELDLIEDKFETNDPSKSKLVGDLFDDPDEDEETKEFKRQLKKYGYSPQQNQEQGGMGGGMFGESLYIGKGKVLRPLNEYEYVKKTPQPMDIVEFQGEQCQIQAVHPDGTMTLLYRGMTVDGVTKGQVKLLTWADLYTPLQFGKFDKFGNPDFNTNPWDEKSEKFHDLNPRKSEGKGDQLVKAALMANGKAYNEGYVHFKDYATGSKFVRVLNEDSSKYYRMPIEDVEIKNPVSIEEWPYAVIVIDQIGEDPVRKIKVNPVSYCGAESDDSDVEVIMAPSSNEEPTRLKKKFIRILA